MNTPTTDAAADLVRRLDAAVDAPNDGARCQQIRDALEWGAARADELLTPELARPDAEHYARRLLHNDPAGRYSAVLMIWNPQQHTPLHDHSGSWCVECVYRGRIRVDSYERTANLCSTTGVWDFEKRETIHAGVGESGALIPPFEYHVIANDEDEVAVTLHVYGGEMVQCTKFEPAATGGFKAEVCSLSYTD
ncbi:Cysteine dioxygenase type I [Planctomycetes bacterium Pla163]|uniref:Cysteine dioxygenase type I n=1 Tax=Rohdeia mirabilis TaxID=2528008 RepID=A0A518CY64_9BACT|nr:Cysteine dioxygenase type I [Planctomycetes bacterium Pla163]